jgi:hypothetical protein
MTTCRLHRHAVRVAGVIPLVLILSRAPARAQAQDEAVARSLFNEGRKLLKAGRFAEACPKLEAASKLYPSAGIFLNLGDCHEKIGRTASAWTEFGDAATIAERTNRDAEAREAQRRQAEVEPKLAHLTINVSHAVAGLVIKRDGAELPAPAWGAAIPVDPGRHEIHADAAGYEPWTTTIAVTSPGQTVPVEVPELSPSPVAVPIIKPEPVATIGALGSAEGPRKRGSALLDWALVGGGAVLAAAGGIIMQVEAGQASDSRATHDSAQYASAKGPWAVGLVGVLAGGATTATGLVLLATRREAPATSAMGVRAYAWAGSRSGGVQLAGSW